MGRLAEELGAARRGSLQAEDHAQHRRLAASVRARHGDELARSDGNVDRLEHPLTAGIQEGDALQLNG